MVFFYRNESSKKVFAFFLLSRKDYPKVDLKWKLKEKHISSYVITSVIEEMEKRQFINDECYLDSFIKKEMKKYYGPMVIYRKLKEKKFEDFIIEDVLQKNYPIDMQIEVMKNYFFKKNKNKDAKKVISSLMRRGFSYSTIRILRDQGILEKEKHL